MKELREILAAAAHHLHEPLGLATVVRVQGSSYRRPGAMMLCLPTRETVGTISGGCLEDEVSATARGVIESGEARLLSFDMRTRQGCNGRIEVLVERVVAGQAASFITALDRCQRDRVPLVAATVFEKRGKIASTLGTHALIDGNARWWGDPAGRIAWGRLFDASREALKTGAAPALHTHHLGDGLATSLLRSIAPPVRLVIFGGSDDAVALAAVATTLGWEVCPVHHPSTDAAKRFTALPGTQICSPEAVGSLFAWDARTVAVIMTHHFGRDAAFLRAMLPQRLPYLGLLGPRRRREELLSLMLAEAEDFPPDTLQSLHAPAGLDLGAESPEQVALAIVAEIQATLAGRAGGLLREMKHPIHAHAP